MSFAVDGTAYAEEVEEVCASVAVDDGFADVGIGVVAMADQDCVVADDVSEDSAADLGRYSLE